MKIKLKESLNKVIVFVLMDTLILKIKFNVNVYFYEILECSFRCKTCSLNLDYCTECFSMNRINPPLCNC